MTDNDANTKKIVVATSLDESGTIAVQEAYLQRRGNPGTELHLVHVLDDSGKDLAALDDTLQESMELLRTHVIAAIHDLPVDEGDYLLPVGHVRIGDASRAIHQLAIDVNADMIIVGTHARRGLERMVLGSVSEKLVRIARTPVLVARRKDFGDAGHSDSVLPPRPGQDMNAPSLSSRLNLSVDRTSHMPGLL